MMLNKLINLFLLLSIAFLNGCKTFEEIQREKKSRPLYQEQFVPIAGMTQKYLVDTSLEYCEAKTSLYAHNTRAKALKDAKNADTETVCDERFGKVVCSVEEKRLNPFQKKKREEEYKKIAETAIQNALKPCMAQLGYVKKSVCVQNCPDFSTPTSLPNVQDDTHSTTIQKNITESSRNSSSAFELTKIDSESLSYQNKAFLVEAQKGNLRAQYNLGLSFVNGQGAKENRKLGISILEASAEKDHFKSQYALGTIYEKEGNYAKAVRWYWRAANLGHLESQFRFGWFNWKGEERGVTKDLTKANYWFEKAAKSGHARAQFMVGAINYKNGQSIEAYKWIHISEENGLADKYIKSSQNLKNKIAQELTESQIENSKRVALVCIESSYKKCGF